MNGYVVGFWKMNPNGSIETELSREFFSPSAAKEHAIHEMQENPGLYEKVLVLECFARLHDETENRRQEFVSTGPEYIRRDGKEQGRLFRAGSPSPSPANAPALSAPTKSK